MQNDRQDWRDNNREDWQDFADANRHHHGDWYHDCWHDGDWDPGDGWDYMWDNYPVMSAFGVTRWGINRLAYGFGYWGYSNPYAGGGSSGDYGYSYSEPLVSYSEPAAPAESAPADAATMSPETDAGLAAFEQSRTAFFGGDYEGALQLLDTTLKTRPNDTVVHEFRGLVLFALNKYPEASAAIYAVLSAGPGWDWTTMSGLYPIVDTYSEQLRALESFVRDNPKSPDGTFLLGYHYLTMGHKDAAAMQFAAALELLPGDKLLTQLAGTAAVKLESASDTPPAPPANVGPPEKVVSVETLAGTWEASSADARFELKLASDSTFVWTYTRGTATQSVKGVFATDQDTLAMEPDAGGTMLAEIDLKSPSSFQFTMMGGEANDPGLQFAKKD
jgi:tetratricopeptide (TPR) repeat protein